MSLNLIPSLRGHGRRRAVDEVDRLRENEAILLTSLHAAGDDIARLQQQLATARQYQAEAEMVVVCQQADLDDLTAERDALAEELAALKAKFAKELAAEANANAITVPLMVRDTSSPEDQATGPIDVRPLQEAAALGLLDGNKPQHVPAWAARD
ncbi:hypothetical protein QFZ63_001624 [Streptomyces sp. B3I7]|uniref:hypothetical protein n=1 Tax=Streptomyces sp. B3I7 TaxID=3042269 RepID=UPI002789233E|nr:hypothetical protein [Streptomyces sp. B3I7]MDQ0809910.1 hypothetical protein [Streptomyces sp. B3I7]